jgi:ABC-type transport system involved in multi-copper enzyme maturation permease subunit
MKFWAILKDSVREAIDFKVFYVMVGLSVLLALLALSLGFTPVEEGSREVIKEAVGPLNGAEGLVQERSNVFVALFGAHPVQFTVESVKPVEGQPDAPSSQFQVRLKATYASVGGAKKAERAPQKLLDFVRERFGHVEGGVMMEASDVRLVGWEDVKLPARDRELKGRAATVALVASPTPATVRFWPHRTSFLFGAVNFPGSASLSEQMGFIEGGLVGSVGSTIAVLVSIVITAFFIPNMLRKGTVDLLLVKPIHRPVLLAYKYVGGLAFMFLNTVVAVGGIWLALGLRSGVWTPTFLLAIPELTFSFAVLYAASTLFGVLTRSPIAAILLTVGVWFGIFIVSVAHNYFEIRRAMDRAARVLHDNLSEDQLTALQKMAEGNGDTPRSRRGSQRVDLDELRWEDNWLTNGVTYFHKALPRTGELYDLLAYRLRHDLAFGTFSPLPEADKPPPELPGGIALPELLPKPPTAGELLGVTTAFIAVMLGLACWRFSRRDY